MERLAFLMRLDGSDREACIAEFAKLRQDFAAAPVDNFSVWHMQQYLFGYCEAENMRCLDDILSKLPQGGTLVCAPGTMDLMYSDIGIVREDKSLIRHRVFATKLKPGCKAEYKRRHDALVEKRGDTITEGPESNFTIWYGDGHIFGYCELVRAYDAQPKTQEAIEASVAWEKWQLEIMDWLTDDVDWISGEHHPAVERVI